MKTKLLNVLYSFGAAIVIFGAWCKILHKPGANTFLTIGLLTEVGIFMVYGVMEWFVAELPDTVKTENGKVDVNELTGAIKETNSILRNIFNTKR